MFSVTDRRVLRDTLIAKAVKDERIIGVALIGSATTGREDEFSDIDLALRLAEDATFDSVVDEWTGWMIREHSVIRTMDLGRSGALYRVFLLGSTLQVDLSFWSYDRFGGIGQEPFVVVYGEDVAAQAREEFDPVFALDMSWLYALHARSSLERGRLWQALHMINGLRDQLVAVWSHRAALNPSQARGVDQLSPGVLSRLKKTVPSRVSPDALRVAFVAEMDLLVAELPELSGTLRTLTEFTLGRVSGPG